MKPEGRSGSSVPDARHTQWKTALPTPCPLPLTTPSCPVVQPPCSFPPAHSHVLLPGPPHSPSSPASGSLQCRARWLISPFLLRSGRGAHGEQRLLPLCPGSGGPLEFLSLSSVSHRPVLPPAQPIKATCIMQLNQRERSREQTHEKRSHTTPSASGQDAA